MKRIIHFLPSTTFSGAENVVCQIINMFRNSDEYEMYYCCPEGKVIKSLEEREIPYIPIKNASRKEIKKVISQYSPDIIHAHDMRASFLVSEACGRIPCVYHIHVNNHNSSRINKKNVLFLFACLKAKHIFWVSESAYRNYRFHRILNKKSSVLYNVINLESLKKKMESDSKKYPYDIVFVGRLTQQKNPQRLVRVIDCIKKEKPDVKVAIIGQGEYEEKLHSMVIENGLQKNVDLLGFLSNPYKIMADAKVLLMTSLWEGTPMCALEAMGIGLPIVSTPTDGMCDLVLTGETGYLSDTDDDLARYSLQIINDENIYQEMHEASINRAEALLNLATYKKNLTEIYESAIKH